MRCLTTIFFLGNILIAMVGCAGASADFTQDNAMTNSTGFASEYSTMYIRGSFNDWGTTPMTLVADNTWQFSTNLSEANYSFKFDATGSWKADSEWGDDNGDGKCDLRGANISLNCIGGNVSITFNDQLLTYQIAGSLSIFRKMPYLILGTNINQMQVLWQAGKAAQNVQVDWGTSPSCGNPETVTSFGSDHQFRYVFTDLPTSTRIYYKVSMDGKTYTNSFLSPPASDSTNLTFYAYGDPRNNPWCQNNVLGYLLADVAQAPDTRQTLLLHSGDWLDHSERESEWDSGFFNMSYPNTMQCFMRIPVMGVRGNHEINADLLRKYYPYDYQDEAGCYYSFDYGPIHVAYIDQYVAYGTGSVQHTWLSNDLVNTPKKWKIAVFHEPGWCPGGGYHEPNQDVRTHLQPLFRSTGVNLVFNAHCHYYSRSMVDGIAHIVTAGAGGGLHNPTDGYDNVVTYSKSHHFCKVVISGSNLQLTAIKDDGSIIETFCLTNTNM